MHPRILAERNEAADAAMRESLARLTERFGLEPAPPPEHTRDVEVQRLHEREYMAAALTDLVAAVEQEDAADTEGAPVRRAAGIAARRAAGEAPEKAPERGPERVVAPTAREARGAPERGALGAPAKQPEKHGPGGTPQKDG